MSMHIPLLVPPVGERDHIRGPVTAPNTLLEFGDYECPHCGAAYPVVEEVRRRMGDQLRFVFRHFPLANMHPHALAAAEAAEAAGAQGRFWEMHDQLYEHQDALTPEDLLVYATAIGLDLVRFGREIDEGAHTPRIQEDVESGLRSGVRGTPTFYINGVQHHGRHDVESLLHGIERARKAA
jgi:protein-disulfide isomerase